MTKAIGALVIVLAIGVLAVALSSRAEETKLPCVPADQIDRIREIMLNAIDTGLQHYIERSFDVLIKDPKDQPQRAIAGVRPAVRAYINARNAALNWVPLVCEEKPP